MKRLVLFIIFIFSIVFSYGQRDVQGNRVIAIDSVYINGEWIYISGASNGEVIQRENGRWVNKTLSGLLNPIDSLVWNGQDNLEWENGKEYYDNATQSKIFYSTFSDIGLNQGEELWTPLVRNVSGGEILDKTPVVINGNSNGLATIDSASNLDYSESRLIGIATHNIANNDSGRVTIYGDVGGDWSGLSTGIVYLGENGSLTNTKPEGGRWVISIGWLHDNSSDGKLFVNPIITERTAELNQTNGFPSSERSGTTISFNPANRYFKIAPNNDEFYYYDYGNKYIKTESDSIQISDITGLHVFYYDTTAMATAANPTDGQVDEAIRTKALIAYAYWNADDDSCYYLGGERHGIDMSPITHAYLHFANGAEYLNGMALSDITVDGDGDVDSTAQFGLNSGVMADEDLIHVMPSYARGSTIPIFYKTGAGGDWHRVFQDGFAVYNTGSANGRLYYNEWTGTVWQLTEVTNNDFILCHIYATNDIDFGYIAIMGEEEYATKNAARAGANTEILDLRVEGFPAEEFVAVASVIFQTSDGFANDVQAKVISTDEGDDYIDWRYIDPSGVAGTATTATAWKDLTDTDNNFSGKADYFPRVNTGETELNLTSFSDIELTELDSTDFRLTTSQTNGLIDSLENRWTKGEITESDTTRWGTNHDEVTLTGSGNYLTLSNQELTKSLIDTLATNIELSNFRNLVQNWSSGGGSSLTPANGLTLRNDSILLGGTLTQDTTFIILDGNTFGIGTNDFAFSMQEISGGMAVVAGLGSLNNRISVLEGGGYDQIGIGSVGNVSMMSGSGILIDGDKGLSMGSDSTILIASGYPIKQSIEFDTQQNSNYGISVMDSHNYLGLIYHGDYSTNGLLNDRWIPDIAAVRGEISDTVSNYWSKTEITEADTTRWGSSGGSSVWDVDVLGGAYYDDGNIDVGTGGTSSQYAIRGTASSNTAIFGNYTGSSGSYYGVYGQSSSSGGGAISGINLSSGVGVIAYSASGIGLSSSGSTIDFIGDGSGLLDLAVNSSAGTPSSGYGRFSVDSDSAYFTNTSGVKFTLNRYGSGGGSMTYPAAGIALSTGSAWGTSITDNSTNWNTAYTDRLKWDGGATGLNAATGRTSLNVDIAGTDNSTDVTLTGSGSYLTLSNQELTKSLIDTTSSYIDYDNFIDFIENWSGGGSSNPTLDDVASNGATSTLDLEIEKLNPVFQFTQNSPAGTSAGIDIYETTTKQFSIGHYASTGYSYIESHTTDPIYISVNGGEIASFDADGVSIDLLELGSSSVYLERDGSNNMTFTDPVTGTKTLAQLAAGSSLWTSDTYGIYTSDNIGIGTNSTDAGLTLSVSESGEYAAIISNTSSTGEGLYVSGGESSISGKALYVQDETKTKDLLTLDASAYMTIGASNSNEYLRLNGDSGDIGIYTDATGDTNKSFWVDNDSFGSGQNIFAVGAEGHLWLPHGTSQASTFISNMGTLRATSDNLFYQPTVGGTEYRMSTTSSFMSLTELDDDPDDPDEGDWVIWMSDGTDSGSDGDIMVKITAGSTTKTITLIDFSAN